MFWGLPRVRRAGRRGYTTFAEPLRPGPMPESSIDSSASSAGKRPLPIHSPIGKVNHAEDTNPQGAVFSVLKPAQQS